MGVIVEDDRIDILKVDLGSRFDKGRLLLVLLALDYYPLLVSHSSILVYLIIFHIALNMKLISVYSNKIINTDHSLSLLLTNTKIPYLFHALLFVDN